MSGESKEKVCRVAIQQCTSASLKFDTEDPPVSIGSGMVIFVCFLQGVTTEHLDNIVKSILQVKLCEETEGSSRDSVLHFQMDVLVIPQATLGGKIKGKSVQYHGLVSKLLGYEVFSKFVEKVKDTVESQGKGKVRSGVYGARQKLTMETNGPFTHIFEF